MGVAGLVGDTAYPEYKSLLPPVPLGGNGPKDWQKHLIK